MTLGSIRRRGLLATAGALATPGIARAQTSPLPAGPIRILVGFPAGGGTDIQARLLAERLRERTGRTFIVENKGGASGTIAGGILAQAAPDGTTIMLAPIASVVMAKLTFTKLNHDPQTDWAPISQVGTFPVALAVSPNHPAKNAAEYVAAARTDPKLAQFGTTALGSVPHFFTLLLGKAAGVTLTPVPYRGAAPLVADLAANQIPSGSGGLFDFIAHHRAGKLRIVAVSSAGRTVTAPDLPTFAEQGYKDAVGDSWLGLFAPAKTPRPVLDALNAAVRAVVAEPDTTRKLIENGVEPKTGTPEELAALQASDIAKWRPIVEASGFKAD